MLEIGTVLHDNYQVTRLLGRGGTAEVYAASHTRLPREVAIKIITSEYNRDQAFIQRFRREAEILASLSHPHFVQVHDWHLTAQGIPYLVMELLQGEDLAARLAEQTLPPSAALSIFRQAASALHAAHQRGIVHRDIKPGNIFICKNGAFPNFVKLLDFGIAKQLYDIIPNSTARSAVIGTPAYMSPEQAMGISDQLDARSDQFSLATVLYEMLARPVFYHPGEAPLATLRRVVDEVVPPLPLQPDASSEMIRIAQALQRALAKDPNERWPSLFEFVSATLPPEMASEHLLTYSGTLPARAVAVPVTLPATETESPVIGAAAKAAPGSLRRPWRSSRGLSAMWSVGKFVALSLLVSSAQPRPWPSGRHGTAPLLKGSQGRFATKSGPASFAPVLAPGSAEPEITNARVADTVSNTKAERLVAAVSVPTKPTTLSSPESYQSSLALKTVPRPDKPQHSGSLLTPHSPTGVSLGRSSRQPAIASRPLGLPPAAPSPPRNLGAWTIKLTGADKQQDSLIQTCVEPLTQLFPSARSLVKFELRGALLRIQPHPDIPPQNRSRVHTCLDLAQTQVHLPLVVGVLAQRTRKGAEL